MLGTRGKSDAGPKSYDDPGRTSTTLAKITASSAEFKCEMSNNKKGIAKDDWGVSSNRSRHYHGVVFETSSPRGRTPDEDPDPSLALKDLH